jgi:hypothetical protein
MFVAAEDNKNEKIIQRCFMRGDLRDFFLFFCAPRRRQEATYSRSAPKY